MLLNIQNALYSICNFLQFLYDNMAGFISNLPNYLNYIIGVFDMLPPFLVPCLGLFVSLSVVNKFFRGV